MRLKSNTTLAAISCLFEMAITARSLSKRKSVSAEVNVCVLVVNVCITVKLQI